MRREARTPLTTVSRVARVRATTAPDVSESILVPAGAQLATEPASGPRRVDQRTYLHTLAGRSGPPARLVALLYVIADRWSAADGGSIHPGEEHLAVALKLSKRQVRRKLVEARTTGWLRRTRRASRAGV